MDRRILRLRIMIFGAVTGLANALYLLGLWYSQSGAAFFYTWIVPSQPCSLAIRSLTTHAYWEKLFALFYLGQDVLLWLFGLIAWPFYAHRASWPGAAFALLVSSHPTLATVAFLLGGVIGGLVVAAAVWGLVLLQKAVGAPNETPSDQVPKR
ncbi:MAG TPA: hypothetical protein VGL40_13735 [Bacillota bacterium]